MFVRARFALVLIVSSLPAGAIAAEPSGDLAQLEQLQNRLADVADRVRPSVVAIRAERPLPADDAARPHDTAQDGTTRPARPDRLYPSIGSGFILSPDGLILTNEHVIHDAEPENIECVLYDGLTYRVQGVTTDPRSDLAVLRIDAKNLRPVKLGDVHTLRQGHFAIVIGNPFGSASENYGRAAMSFGVVSALGQDLTQKLDLSQQRHYGNLIQTDARINPGNSGGPLANIRGEVIGITTAISTRSGSSEGVGYAIAFDERIRSVVTQLMRGEEVEYGYIGVRLDRPTDMERRTAGAPLEGGAVVKEVQPDSPAAAANLAAGDVVVEFEGRPVKDVDQLVRMVGAARVGQNVNVVFYRENQRKTAVVVPERKQVLKGVHREAPLDWNGMRLADPCEEICSSFNLANDISGVVVIQVESNGPAEKAGLKPGTVIQQIDGQAVRSLRQLRETLTHFTGRVRLKTAENTEVVLP